VNTAGFSASAHRPRNSQECLLESRNENTPLVAVVMAAPTGLPFSHNAFIPPDAQGDNFALLIGKHIYFNSERSGSMQIWRMNTDGTGQTQVTRDQFNNWFAHPSPDGKWLVFLSYAADVKGHPGEKAVQLRLMNLSTGEIQPLARLFGGQGTINVPSWSPDSKEIAFVSYHFGP
jgi:hypothetical protein